MILPMMCETLFIFAIDIRKCYADNHDIQLKQSRRIP